MSQKRLWKPINAPSQHNHTSFLSCYQYVYLPLITLFLDHESTQNGDISVVICAYTAAERKANGVPWCEVLR